MKTATVAGIDLVIYRTQAGELCCVQDRCPHMSGRFSAGGKINNDELICPVHRFRFAPDGTCRGSGYDTPAPKACTRPWPCLDRNGLLLVYFHPDGEAPDWEPPQLESGCWKPMSIFLDKVATSAQIVMQGIADMGHLRTVHGYEDVQMDSDFHTEGAQLKVSYSFTYVGSLPGLGGSLKRLGERLQTRTRVRFDYLACGIGYSVTHVQIPAMGVAMRHFVNPTPLDADTVVLYHSIALNRIENPATISPVFKFFPRSWTQALMRQVLLRGYRHDIEDDMALWTQMRNPLKRARLQILFPKHQRQHVNVSGFGSERHVITVFNRFFRLIPVLAALCVASTVSAGPDQSCPRQAETRLGTRRRSRAGFRQPDLQQRRAARRAGSLHHQTDDGDGGARFGCPAGRMADHCRA